MRKILEKLSGPKKVMAGVCAATVVGTSIGVCYMNSTTVEAEETSVNAQSEEVDLAEDDTEVILSKLLTKSVENASGAEVDKEETVYIIGDANGENPEIIVTDWLRNPSASATIDDVTTLSDVTNLKGDEVYTPQSGDEVIWAADGNDIHYQGSTDAQLPILVKVTYFLDGKEIAPEDLAGKSGHVKIRLDYTNNATTQITVADREETINVPFGVMSGMLLDTDKFYNISVKNGKVVDQGNIAMVVGLAFPGLMESLDVDQDLLEDMTIPDYIEVEADTTDFALDMTLSVAMTDALSEFTLDPDALNSDELNDAIDELSDASTQLVDGTGELSDGVSELSDGTAELKDGTSSLLDGATALKEGADSLDGGMQTLFCGIRTYTDGVKNLKEGMGELKYASTLLYNGAAQIGSYMSSLKAGIDSLNSSVTKLHTLSTLSSSYNTQKLTSCVYAAQSYLTATEKAYLSQALSSSDGMTMFVMATKVMEMLDANLLADHGYSLNTAVAAQMAQGASAQAVIGAMVQSALTQYASSGLTLSSAQQSALIEYCYITYLISTNDTTLHGAVTTSDGTFSVAGLSSDITTALRGSSITIDVSALMANLMANSLNSAADTETETEEAECETETETETAEETETETAEETETETDTETETETEEEAEVETETETEDATSSGDTGNGSTSSDDTGSGSTSSGDTGSGSTSSGDTGNGSTSSGSGNDSDNDGSGTSTPGCALILEERFIPNESCHAETTVAVSDLVSYDDLNALVTAAIQQELAGATTAASSSTTPSYAEISAMVYNVFIDQTISALADEQSGVPALANGAAALNDGIASFVSNYQEFDLGLATATEGAQKLNDASTDLISGSQELAQGSTTLAEGCGDLADGSAALDDGALQLQEGVAKLQDGTEELHQGMVTFDEEGIQELTERVNDGCGDLDEFTDRLDGVLEAGRSYQSYSGLANGASGDVKFIYKTGAVK